MFIEPRMSICAQNGTLTHTEFIHFAFLVICVEFKDIEDGLGIFSIIFLCDCGVGQEFVPLFREALRGTSRFRYKIGK
jgi:hypothetical protein